LARKPARPPATTGDISTPQSNPNGLKEALDQQIGPLVPQQQRGEIVGRVYSMLVSERFSGPMPHPRHLREYDEILPGAAERILVMAERAQSHNAEMEGLIIRGEVYDQKLGLWLGFAALIVLVGLASLFGFIGNIAMAALLLSAAALGVISVFVTGRFRPKS